MLAMVYIPVRNCVIATATSRWLLTLSLVTLVLNAGVSYVLGFGSSLSWLTITGMGTSGIALASTIVDSMLFAGFVCLPYRIGVDSTLFSSALMLAGRHVVQGMATIGLILEWSAL